MFLCTVYDKRLLDKTHILCWYAVSIWKTGFHKSHSDPNHHAYKAQMLHSCQVSTPLSSDHGLLTDKVALYGFDQDAVDLVTSYRGERSQCVLIEGCLSELQPVNVGVPQGSILRPLLYTLFTNELPEVIHDNGHVGEQEQGVIKRTGQHTN